jgi:hypothetical protein
MGKGRVGGGERDLATRESAEFSTEVKEVLAMFALLEVFVTDARQQALAACERDGP